MNPEQQSPRKPGKVAVVTAEKQAGFGGTDTPYEFSQNPTAKIDMGPIRTLVVDDHELARHDIRSVLANNRDIELIEEINNGEEAIKKVRDLHPDVVLLDISLPRISGIEVANTLRQIAPESRIIFVSQHDSPLIAKDALLTGAYGYVVKADIALDLLLAIKTVHEGHTFISRTLHAMV
jgi:DNA-binding NarL/FixJ family response regulator